MFICGSGSFGHEDENENESYNSPCHTPKRSKRSTSFCKIIGKDSSNKNPYADRGLDKFYALLADLDDKKQKIYTQMGSEDISFVRFVYTNDDSNHVKPIVVKIKEKKQEKSSTNLIKQTINNAATTNPAAASDAADKISATTQSAEVVPKEDINEKTQKKRRCLRCNGSFRLENLRRPYYYFPVIVVLILLFLAIYGRSFAILCTSIGWYLVPSIVGDGSSSSISSNERKPKRKKEYVRKPSDKKIVHSEKEYVRKQSEKKMVHSEGPSSPTSVINCLTDNKTQQQQQQQHHGHRRSW